MLDMAPGTVFGGRFTLLNLLARGERGNVWHSRDEQTGREVALRILDPALSSSREEFARLERAYTISARLDHPNVLGVGGASRFGQQVAQPMEFAPKGDAETLRGAPLYAVVPVLIDVAEALAFAHARGIYHLDLRLDRILIAADGSGRVAWFGRDPAAEESSAANGERIDIAAFGKIAYQLLVQVPGGQRWLPRRLEAMLAEILNRDAKTPLAPMVEIVEELRESLRDTTPLSDYVLPRLASAVEIEGDDVVEFSPDLQQPSSPPEIVDRVAPLSEADAHVDPEPVVTQVRAPAVAKVNRPWGRMAAGLAVATTMLFAWRALAPTADAETAIAAGRALEGPPTKVQARVEPVIAAALPEKVAESIPVDSIALEQEAAARSIRASLRAGDWALESFDAEAAGRAYRKVLAIDPANSAARSGLASVNRLPGLKALIQDAQAAEQRGDLGRALKGYSQALANDRTSRLLRASVERLRSDIGLDAFGKAMSDGYVALGAGKLDRANDAFSKALRLRPTADAALSAQAEVEAALAARAAAAEAADERATVRTSASL